MSTLTGQGGELRATLQITRKATGKVETYEIVGRTTPEQHEKIMAAGGKVHAARGALAGPGAAVKTQENDQ